MASSSPPTRALPALPALLALSALALLGLGVSGCAHARAARSDPPRAAASPAWAGAVPPGRLDPSEEITPEELASIPEPVPATTAPAPIRPAPKASGEAAEPRSGGAKGETSLPADSSSSPPAPRSPAPPSPGAPWIWRVQILATPDRALAERVAREAAERLGTVSRIDEEPPLHKVRLGGFGSEADAQVLKSRAVEMGYPGAFRVKIRAAATDE